MNLNYFTGITIPEHKVVRILNGNNNIDPLITTPQGIEVPLILDEQFSMGVKSSYKDLTSFQSNTFLNLLSTSTNGVVPSGQFTLQSAQVWDKTDPLDLSFTVKINMNTNGKDDVVYPVNTLMQLVVPSQGVKNVAQHRISSKANAKSLVPPGPNFQAIWAQIKDGSSTKEVDEDFDSKGVFTIKIGKFIFQNMVLTSVDPTFSNTVDEDGYPVSASVSISALSIIIPTTNYLETVMLS